MNPNAMNNNNFLIGSRYFNVITLSLYSYWLSAKHSPSYTSFEYVTLSLFEPTNLASAQALTAHDQLFVSVFKLMIEKLLAS